jgi:hypothetical protein
MTAERAAAHKTAIKIINDLGPSKFSFDERSRLIEAADSFLFADDSEATLSSAEDALTAAEDELTDVLDRGTDSDAGISPELADTLFSAIRACGPQPVLVPA